MRSSYARARCCFTVTWVPMQAHMLQKGTYMCSSSHANGLKSMDSNGFDPYCKLTLKGETKKSKTIKKTLDPVWNESFTWKGVLKDLIAEPMQLHAWDYDFGSKDDPLGGASISLSQLEHSRTARPAGAALGARCRLPAPLVALGGRAHAATERAGCEAYRGVLARRRRCRRCHSASARTRAIPAAAPARQYPTYNTPIDPTRLAGTGQLKIFLKRALA